MAGKLAKQTAALPLDRTLRLAVVADTHSQPHARTAELLTALAPDAILHAGDIGDLAVIEDLRTIAPVHAIRGNIDTRIELPDILTIDLGDKLRLMLMHIAVYGPKLRADAARLARAEKAQLVVCGHSHVPFIGRDQGIAIFNPGSCGPRRFHLPIVFGTIEVSPTSVKMAHVDCETGRAWSPP